MLRCSFVSNQLLPELQFYIITDIIVKGISSQKLFHRMLNIHFFADNCDVKVAALKADSDFITFSLLYIPREGTLTPQTLSVGLSTRR